MKKYWKKFRFRLEYVTVLAIYGMIRVLPHGAVRAICRFLGWLFWYVPGTSKLVMANLRVAFPEKSTKELKRIGKESLFHLVFNLIEFFWFNGNPNRIRKWCRFEQGIAKHLEELLPQKIRFIFVNPHLGSWEASAVSGTLDTGFKMAAVAKKMRNPHLDKLYNSANREKGGSVKIIFSNGAMRASLRALQEGYSVGILIDQNTKVRDGGVFIDFFGLPCLSSTSPALMHRYCQSHGVPSMIVSAATIRMPDGKLESRIAFLSKPFDQYADDRELTAELIKWGEEMVRQYPEQYLWFYKRFNYYPADASAELKKRYPYYSNEESSKRR